MQECLRTACLVRGKRTTGAENNLELLAVVSLIAAVLLLGIEFVV